jgi:hypothetical protein
MMNWKGSERKLSCPNLRYYLGICPEGFEDNHEKRQVSLSPGRDLNLVPHEYALSLVIG